MFLIIRIYISSDGYDVLCLCFDIVTLDISPKAHILSYRFVFYINLYLPMYYFVNFSMCRDILWSAVLFVL